MAAFIHLFSLDYHISFHLTLFLVHDILQRFTPCFLACESASQSLHPSSVFILPFHLIPFSDLDGSYLGIHCFLPTLEHSMAWSLATPWLVSRIKSCVHSTKSQFRCLHFQFLYIDISCFSHSWIHIVSCILFRHHILPSLSSKSSTFVHRSAVFSSSAPNSLVTSSSGL